MDIVADVLSMADSAKVKVASQNLENLARSKSKRIETEAFQFAINRKENGRDTPAEPSRIQKDQSRLPGGMESEAQSADALQKASKKAAMQKLETVLATKMVESMMPKDQSRIYGEGTAGDVWRGFHIEAMGKALAGQGLFEISKDQEVHQTPAKRHKILPFAG